MSQRGYNKQSQSPSSRSSMIVHRGQDGETTNILTSAEYNRAAERGRQMAVQAMILNPEQRELVEKTYGIKYCRNRYPEVYANAKF